MKYRVADLKRAKGRRREARGESAIVNLPEDRELDALWHSARRAAILRQARKELLEHSHLAEKPLLAFDAYVLRGQPAEQVAQELDMSVNSVYVAKNRVAEKLRDIVTDLEQVYDEDL